MIPFDFDYYKPETVEEAAAAYRKLSASNKKPLYYGGGTEIITMARLNNIDTEAVIDIKNIPEHKVNRIEDDKLIMGSCITLTEIVETDLFPLLHLTAGRVADHTVQGKITLGGNIAGTVIYRETVLPLLLADAEIIFNGINGSKVIPIAKAFNQRLLRDNGDFISQIIVNKSYLNLPFVHVKKTKVEKIGYPLVTVAAIKKDGLLRAAFSGVCSFPFRSGEMEQALNDQNYTIENRVSNSLNYLPAEILTDSEGSGEYRKFVLKNTLINTLQKFEGV